MRQWKVTVTDNAGDEHLFVVGAPHQMAAKDKARGFFKRQAAAGRYVASIRVEPA